VWSKSCTGVVERDRHAHGLGSEAVGLLDDFNPLRIYHCNHPDESLRTVTSKQTTCSDPDTEEAGVTRPIPIMLRSARNWKTQRFDSMSSFDLYNIDSVWHVIYYLLTVL